MGAPELVIPELVVVDTRDGFIFWQDDAGRFFTEESVVRFLEERSPVCVLRKLAVPVPVQAELYVPDCTKGHYGKGQVHTLDCTPEEV